MPGADVKTATALKTPVRWLGQSGFRFDFSGFIVFTDPYLSDSVAALDGPEFKRLHPPPVQPDEIRDASLVLISHIHLDHCDPDTLLPISRASPTCLFMGPAQVLRTLETLGLDPGRLLPAREYKQVFGPGITITAVPAAHKNIERETDGSLRFVGYIIQHDGQCYYHAGDTSVNDYVLKALVEVGPIDVAFLPVNECNFYRDRRGIVGNMSVRDAFRMAEELSVPVVVPMHYDMFALNCVYRDEIQIIYEQTRPGFRLVLDPGNL